MIYAKHDNGTPVRAGDRVFVRRDNNNTAAGAIGKITGSERFSYLGYVELQTYIINCDDGRHRPAHAWHIKKVFDNSKKRKAA